MKKSVFKIAILLSAIAIMTTSCSKDNDDGMTTVDGKYKLTLDGKNVAEGNTKEVGMVGNAISLSEGEDFGILVSGVPESVGDEVAIGGAGSAASVSITGKNLLGSGEDELYFSINGKIKRTSASKITFEGTCSGLTGVDVYTFSGTAESNAYKII